jgi:methylated-DNA-[protein]-cysteine S-methyltransferase
MKDMGERSNKSYFFSTMRSPLGVLKLVASGDGLAAVLWEKENPRRVRLNVAEENDAHPILIEAKRQLGQYFAGERQVFDLRLDFAGTEFQKSVWQALLTIPYGDTRSYGELAHQIGNRKAVRAVGAANGRNPISIIVPCHRVIGASGSLTGFGGGLEAKAFLLNLESKQLPLGQHAGRSLRNAQV